MNSVFLKALSPILFLAAAWPVKALTIVRTNDPSVASQLSPADVAAANAAFDYAASRLAALIGDSSRNRRNNRLLFNNLERR